MAIYILLGIIAVGVLLLSDTGKQILSSAFSALWVLLITSGFVAVGIFLWAYVKDHQDQIGSGIESTVPTIAGIGLLIWLGNKIAKINKTEDSELNKLGKFIKHTGSGMAAVYLVLIYLVAGVIVAFFT